MGEVQYKHRTILNKHQDSEWGWPGKKGCQHQKADHSVFQQTWLDRARQTGPGITLPSLTEDILPTTGADKLIMQIDGGSLGK